MRTQIMIALRKNRRKTGGVEASSCVMMSLGGWDLKSTMWLPINKKMQRLTDFPCAFVKISGYEPLHECRNRSCRMMFLSANLKQCSDTKVRFALNRFRFRSFRTAEALWGKVSGSVTYREEKNVGGTSTLLRIWSLMQ